MMRLAVTCLFLTILFIEACNQGYIVNMNEQTTFPEGRNLFISKCNACHQLYDPASYTEAEWDSILVPMQSKAKLDDKQRNTVFNWILEAKNRKDKKVQLK